MQAMEARKIEAAAMMLREPQEQTAGVRVVTGDEGRAVADTVDFTGDPAWDEAMLEEVGEDAEELDPEFVAEFLG